nr:hypothetical protein [uncultured Oscillibacter sp.]
MDHRQALPPGTLLPFPAMFCTLTRELGRGSNAIVYLGSYPDLLNREEQHTVLIKELFPFHPKAAVFREENGVVSCAPDARETWDLHQQSFEYGNRVHLRMLETHPDLNGANLNTFSLNGTLYTVLGFTGGRSLEEEAPGPEADLRRLTTRMLSLLDALEAFHESGFLHLDIAPDNILLIGREDRERAILIDYNSVYDCKASTLDRPSYCSVKPGYTAPELRTGGTPTAASDLYAVAAVFYRCLSGAALTPFQMSRPNPPDVSSCPCLENLPDTVSVMARQILRRGLQALPKRRYQSAGDMRQAFQELLDRIDGVGVTHWALWESGRKIVERVIRENPGLAFLLDREALFPSRLRLPDGALAPAAVSAMFSGQSRAALLTASGGMGKTTSMLRSVIEQSRTYSPSQSAMAYISLYGWKDGESSYIHRRLLENLRFKTEQYDAARYALDTLLETPLETRSGEQRPVLILLLDGLNEASGETRPLMEEILSFSHMPGVRLLISSRSEEPALPFPQAELAPLTGEDVTAVLTREGLLAPERPEMRELLRTPLMLSIFLQSARAESRQLSVSNQEELLSAYFGALLNKELQGLPNDADIRWQTDAAMSFVLPAIARELQQKGHALEDAEVLPTVERCYRLFSDRLLRRAFPQWIGHSKAIRGGSANAEEWYGLLIHELLWKRLGLLVRDEQGRYRICHETVAEYLTTIENGNARKLLRQRRLRRALAAAALALCLVSGWFYYAAFIRPPAYSGDYEEAVFVYGLNGYSYAARQYEKMRGLIDCALETPEQYSREKESFDYFIDRISDEATTDYMLDAMQRMLLTGEVFSWSYKKLDDARYQELLKLEQERRDEYKTLASVLTYVMEDPRGNRLYGDTYPELLSELVELDADIAAALYEIVCIPHLTSTVLQGNEALLRAQHTLEVSAAELNLHLSGETDLEILNRRLLNLQGRRTAARYDLGFCGAIAAYQHKEGIS